MGLTGGCKWFAKSSTNMEGLPEAVRRGDDAYKQYRTAGYPTAKTALQNYIQFPDRLDCESVGVEVCKATRWCFMCV
jgi:hypothetical protein